MISKMETCNVTYIIGNYFTKMVEYPTHISVLGGGHFVTRLANSYDILTPDTLSHFTEIFPVMLNLSITVLREVIYIDNESLYADTPPVLVSLQ